MGDMSDISISRSLQKDQERERRRQRDRERRQSMTLEQRERHLARRRRNYQLRRERAVVGRQSSSFVQTGIPTGSADSISNDPLPGDIVPEKSMCGNGSGHVRSEEEHDKLDKQCANLPCLNIPAEFRGIVRLTHIKHLARSLHTTVKENAGDKQQSTVDVGAEGSGTLNCGSGKVLRLNHVKRLAREASIRMKGISDQNHLSEADESSLPTGENCQKTSDVRNLIGTGIEGKSKTEIPINGH